VNGGSWFEFPNNVQLLTETIIFNRGKLKQVRRNFTGGRGIHRRRNDFHNNEGALADNY
jgi:hypothetical protein